MSTLSAVLVTIVGLGLIGLAARDIFDALFHPEGRASLARGVMRVVWRMFRGPSRRNRASALAGPVGLVAVIGTWVVLLACGWALIYWPHIADGFSFSESAGNGPDLIDALNISLVTLTTLGFGDVTPQAEWLRIASPLEALLGFGLLSASISWLLLTYPVLARRRSLAYEISLLRKADRENDLTLDDLGPDAAERMYQELASRLVAVERDFVSFPVTYYFAERDDRFSLALSADYLYSLAKRGCSEGRPARTRLRAQMLLEAIDDLAATIGERFHRGASGSTAELLAAYARDHAGESAR